MHRRSLWLSMSPTREGAGLGHPQAGGVANSIPKTTTAKMRTPERGRREVAVTLALVAIALLACVALLWPRHPVAKTPHVALEPPPLPIATPVATPPFVPAHPLLVHATKPPPAKPAPAAKGEGRLRLVVQPYGTLVVDGREMGDIPRPPLALQNSHVLGRQVCQ